MRLSRPACNCAGFAFALFPILLAACPGQSSPDPSAECLTAAADAAETVGVPYSVLLAVTLVETGQTHDGHFRPWPWTVNDGGEGRWFSTKDEAVDHAAMLLDQGATNVDLGCFQLNYRWHGAGFGSLADMLDPVLNARYAATFLATLYEESGNWSDAAAAYHSRTPEYAEIYRARFDRVLAALDGDTPVVAEAEARPNQFPLLVRGQPGRFGSLVPITDAMTRLIGAP